MTTKTKSASKLRTVQALLFFLILLGFTLASLIPLCASPAPTEAAMPFSLGTLLDGTFLEKNGVWASVLSRDVLYDNQTPPQLLLMGPTELQLELGSRFSEPGYFSQDAQGHELTDRVQVYAMGDHVVYEVHDDWGNSSSVSRTLSYVDTTPPELRLTDAPELHIPVGGDYTEPGCIARDSADGDISDQISITGTVDTKTVGIYVLTYSVQDSAGNQNTVTRTVYVDALEESGE